MFQQTGCDHQQLDWDDSALTITINPMQADEAGVLAAGGVQIACVSDDSCSESENSDSEDDERKIYCSFDVLLLFDIKTQKKSFCQQPPTVGIVT